MKNLSRSCVVRTEKQPNFAGNCVGFCGPDRRDTIGEPPGPVTVWAGEPDKPATTIASTRAVGPGLCRVASVEEGIDILPSGSYRARARIAGEQITIAIGPELGRVVAALSEHRKLNARGLTLTGFAPVFFTWREREGARNVVQDRGRWARHVERDPIARRPLVTLTRREIRAWMHALLTRPAAYLYPGARGDRPLARQTVRNVFYLVRAALRDACMAELIVGNPADGIRVPALARIEDPWTYLGRAEIDALRTELVLHADRRTGLRLLTAVLVAIGSGLREGEMRALRWRHVLPELGARHPCLDVREGSPGKPTKTKLSKRRVPLFGVALVALRAWAAVVGVDVDAPVFATSEGAPYAKGSLFDLERLRRALDGAGITRNVRVHDLRHTAAAALVSGYWGRAWSLEEVRLFLGHSTIAMTERYAHLAPGVLERAARETPGEL